KRRLPETVKGGGDDGRRKETARALRKDEIHAGGRGPRRLALHVPSSGGDEEGRDRHLEGPADSVLRSLRGRLAEVAGANPKATDAGPKGMLASATGSPVEF